MSLVKIRRTARASAGRARAGESRAWQAVRLSIDRAYQRAKDAIAAEAGTLAVPPRLLDGLYRSIARHHWSFYADGGARSDTVEVRSRMDGGTQIVIAAPPGNPSAGIFVYRES